MREIAATKGYVILVDDEDYERLAQYKWHPHVTGSKSNPYIRPVRFCRRCEGKRSSYLVHEILRAPPGMVVDHINGNQWDNRRSNLRICSRAENARNRRKHKGKNQYKGVYPLKAGNYQVLCCRDGKSHYLGVYDDPAEAARVYDEAALRLHGEFAQTNFPSFAVSA